jgi:hypothetical protein
LCLLPCITFRLYARIEPVSLKEPHPNHSIPEQFIFGQEKSYPVIVNFQGKPVTSDAELTLIAELDRKRKITSRLAACFKDYRDPNKVLHPVHNLIAQRIYGQPFQREQLY